MADAAAILLQANPALTPNLVKAILMYSAQTLACFNTFEQGAGELNIDAKMVKTTLPTTNRAALLNGALLVFQTSTITGETVFWGKGVITNYGFLYGNDLMNFYQGLNGPGVPYAPS